MVKKRLILFLMIMALLPLSSVRVSAENPGDIDLEAGYVDFCFSFFQLVNP